MVHEILEEHKFVNVGNSSFIAANEDIFNGSPATDIVNLDEWRKCIFVLQKGAGAVGTATLTVESCDDTDATTTTAVAFRARTNKTGLTDTWTAWADVAATGLAITAGADEMYEVLIQSDGLSTTDKYARVQLTETEGTAVDGAITAIMLEPRYGKKIHATVLT